MCLSVKQNTEPFTVNMHVHVLHSRIHLGHIKYCHVIECDYRRGFDW
jgi:hypothetical protein